MRFVVLSMEKGNFFPNQEDKKTVMLQLLLLFCLLLAKTGFNQKQIDDLTFIRTYCPIISTKNYNYYFDFCTKIESKYAVQTDGIEKRKTVNIKAIRQTTMR